VFRASVDEELDGNGRGADAPSEASSVWGCEVSICVICDVPMSDCWLTADVSMVIVGALGLRPGPGEGVSRPPGGPLSSVPDMSAT
jgi:hypothetical protein